MSRLLYPRHNRRRLLRAAVFGFLCLSVTSLHSQQPSLRSGVPRRSNGLTPEVWETIQEASKTYGIPSNFIAAVINEESGFHALALSRKGAMGMMQLMPETAWSFGVQNPFDPRENIFAGARYLHLLLARYKGNATLALAAYNAGTDAVGKYRGVPPYNETINYINRITRLYQTHELANLQHLARVPSIPLSTLGTHEPTSTVEDQALAVPPLPSSISKTARTQTELLR